MKITSHAVGAVIVRIEADGRVIAKQIDYTKDRGMTWRHMMESGEDGETVLETLQNGLQTEVAADPAQFEYRLMRPEPILVEFGADQKDPDGTHMKVFFLVELVHGDVRTVAKEDGPDTTVGPVRECEMRALIVHTEGKTVPIHFRASKAALLALSPDPRIFNRYSEIILTTPALTLNAEQQAAVDAYPSKW